MEIRVDNVNQLSWDRQGKLLYNHSAVDRPWRKTLYSIDGNQLICRHFNLIGLFLHLLGYKKEFNSQNLTSYLKNNIKTLTGNENVNQTVAFGALRKFNEIKRNYFFHGYKSEEEAIALFKEQGLDVNVYERSMGKTALMEACSRGEFTLAKYLIEQGANINHKEKDEGFVSLTALHWSFHSKNPNVIELLIDSGADLDAQDAYGRRGFFLLVESYIEADPKDEKKIKLLNLVHKALAKKPNLTLKGMNHNLLQMACKKGNLEMVQLLIKHGAEISITPNSENLHLVFAIESGNVELVRWLHDQGMSLDYKRVRLAPIINSFPSDTPLVEALQLTPKDKVLEMVSLILERGQNPNESIRGDRTPLRIAVQKGILDVVKLLVEKGATDFKGALEEAKRLGHNAIVEYLESVILKV